MITARESPKLAEQLIAENIVIPASAS